MNLRKTLLLLAAALSIPSLAQTNEMPDWQKAAGGKMAFDVASVRPDTGDFKVPSIAMSTDDGMQPSDGIFHADFPLAVDIQFAYKISLAPEQQQAMQASLPKWVKTDRYEIQARSPGKPTKDQVRLMMQSLLEERFGLKVHVETSTVPVFALMLAKPGKPGPNLIPHAQGPPCLASDTPQPSALKPVFPEVCGVYSLSRNADGNTQWGSRNTTLALVAASIPSLGALGSPVVDQTGLTGNYDISVEFSMEATRNAMRATSASASPDAAAESQPGIAFLDAVREQLGLKLESTQAPVQMLVVDHIEPPSEN
jgi:uncharacterized protein (TIGR03435 family)